MSRLQHRTDRGSALLWIAVAIVVVLLGWALFRAFVTSTTRSEARAVVEARLCQALAESAIAELEAGVGWQVNDLRSPLAMALRRQVFANQRGDVELGPYVSAESAFKLLEMPIYNGYSLDFGCRVEFQRQLDNVPYEKRGMIVFSATAKSPGLVRRLACRVELARWLKTTLVTIPRPFGGFGIFIANATGMTDVEAVNRLRDQAATRARQLRATVQGLASRAPAGFAARYKTAAGEMFDPDAAGAMPLPLALPPGTAVYGMVQPGGCQHLAYLDMATRFTRLLENAEVLEKRLASSSARIDSTDSATHDEILKDIRDAANAVLDPLFELWTFHQGYAVLPPTNTKPYGELRQKLYKLQAEYFRRRAHWMIQEGPGRPDPSTALRTLLAGGVHGIVLVENRTSQVEIKGTVPGRVIVVVGPGGARISGVNPPPCEKGLVTVFASSGPVQVTGQNSVSLIIGFPDASAAQAQLSIAADALIAGNLVLAAIPPGRLDGQLERVAAHLSGSTGPGGTDEGFPDRLFVGLSPQVAYRRVVRP